MRWASWLGRLFALSWLVLLWPVLGAYFHLQLSAFQVAGLSAALAAYAGVYAFFCFWGYRRRDPVFVVSEVIVLSLLALAINGISGLKTPNPFLLPLIVVGFGLRPRPGFLAILVLSAVALIDTFVGLHVAPGEAAVELAVLAPQLLLAGVAAMGLRYLLDVQAELRAARAQIARLAADEERARISRDLHDLLGHSLSLIAMKGELASRLVAASDPGGAEVREMVRLTREALREVREAVSGYRQPTLATELSAARTALEVAGIRVDVEQSIGAISREAEAVLGWAIREGVTNVIRHSGASHCSIVLSTDDGLVSAAVSDDGSGAGGGAPGTGLRGLSERVDAIGGQLEAGRRPSRGYRLRVTAPTGRPR